MGYNKKDSEKNWKTKKTSGKPKSNDVESKATRYSGKGDRDQKRFNSPDWLNHNPELIEAAGRINFATRLGVPYAFNSQNSTDVGSEFYSIPNPSFMALYYVPTFGISTNGVSALNLSALGLMTKVRTAISGSRSYDPNDLMLHILAVSSVIDFINIAVRAYGVATYYNAWDATTPKAYLEAMGFDFDSVSNNMAYFNGLINKAILKISNLAIPASIKYLNRHAALSANIFADGALIDRAQKYFFMPILFHKLIVEPDPDETYRRL